MQEEKLKDLSVQPVPALLSHPIWLSLLQERELQPGASAGRNFPALSLLVPAALVEPFPSSPAEVERSRRCSGCGKARR